MNAKKIYIALIFCLMLPAFSYAQDSIPSEIEPEQALLKISGELNTDQRFLLQNDNNWVWNENRLNLKLEKKITDNSKFYSEVWFRNFGIPQISNSSELYNKGILDPYNIEIREVWVQLNGFLSDKLDLTIGRQRMVWGTADKLNPTDNLNPYDFEDILDFGRHRSSDAINLNYYINNDFSIQGIFLPFFRPANLPVGIFSNSLNPAPDLPNGLIMTQYSDTLNIPRNSLAESASTGFKFKGFFRGVDFSISYVWGYDGLPFISKNTLTPIGLNGETNIESQLTYARMHVFGADMATSIAGIGFWAEAALFKTESDILMTNDVSAFYALPPMSITEDSIIIKKSEPYLKFVLGVDYHFADASYLNFQYMHGFVHERGREQLNDYFFLRYEMKFLNEKLVIMPISGGIAISNWENVSENHAFAYMPEINYKANENAEIGISAVIIEGKGSNLLAGLNKFDQVKFSFTYSF